MADRFVHLQHHLIAVEDERRHDIGAFGSGQERDRLLRGALRVAGEIQFLDQLEARLADVTARTMRDRSGAARRPR